MWVSLRIEELSLIYWISIGNTLHKLAVFRGYRIKQFKDTIWVTFIQQ